MFLFNLRSAISSPQEEIEPSPVDTVGRLADRISTSLLLEDKREACKNLKNISRKHRLEVGAHALNVLTEVLHCQPDTETLTYVLETLDNVTSPEVFEEEAQEGAASCGAQFTEIFLKKQENVTGVIDVLDEYDFRVRLPAIHLLMNLLANKPKEMQEIVLACPMGVAKLIDILSDSRDFVRNEVLLLLIQLTKSNSSIQNIIAYERGFDQLFQVIHSEGYSDGGVVVNDSLQLMLNLLERNVSNQTVFREESCMTRIMPFFQSCKQSETDSNGVWSDFKSKNVHSMLKVVRTMVSPANASQLVTPAQKAVASCGLLEELCSLLTTQVLPTDVLSEIVCTVGESIRGNRSNQEFFGGLNVSIVPPRTALVLLLTFMVNEKVPLLMRTAVLYCFQCYVFKNDMSQGRIVQALLPTSADAAQVLTPGQLLCGGLISTDSLSHWLCSAALSHTLVENTNNKELLLRVHLATARDAQPVSLLQLTFETLAQGGKIHTRLGILTLLSTWLAECPNAVAQFLKLPNAVAFLTGQVASNEHDENEVLVQSMCAFLLGLCIVFNNDSNSNFTKDSLRQVITKRIGVETFIDKLAEIAKHVAYTKALKHPQNRIENHSDLPFDYEFCRLYKGLENVLAKAVAPPSSTEGGESPSDEELKAVAKYKEVIREQDAQIQHLRQRLAALEAEHIVSQSKIEELNSSVQQLADENTLLKAQRNNNVIIDHAAVTSSDQTEMLQREIENLRLENEKQREELERRNLEINKSNGVTVEFAGVAQSASILDSFDTSHDQDIKVCSFFRPDSSDSNSESKTRLEALESELAKSQEELIELKKELAGYRSVTDELDRVKKDQEDLLVLLADQDAQVSKYKERLKNLGETVTDDDEDDDLDDVADDGSLSDLT